MAEKRFLHIMPDDKFLDYFIEQSESVSPGASIYWVILKGTEKPQYVKSNLIEFFFWNSRPAEELIDYANQFEQVFLHSFKLNMADFILRLKPSLYITWMFWGYEVYDYTANERKWFLPETWLLKKKFYDEKPVSLGEVYRNLRRKYSSIKNRKLTWKILRRINRCATWVKPDYEMIQQINPKMEWADYNYFSFNQLGLDLMEREENNYSNIWIGNSGALTNNHADTLLALKKLDWKGDVYMPLAYGGIPVYREEIIRLGKKYFGSRFHPVTDFLPLSEYQKLINKCGLVWMNHIRQQAAGNILAALYMGKAVILHPSSNLYKTLRSWNLKLHTDFKSISSVNVNQNALNASKKIIEENVSLEHTIKNLRHLYISRKNPN